MKLKILKNEFAVCKLDNLSAVDYTDEYYFIGKTEEEISLVCSASCIPNNTLECDRGWRAFRIQGMLDFSLIGILSKLSTILANHSIGIFAISTFNTDYILTKEENFEKALVLLEEAGYELIK